MTAPGCSKRPCASGPRWCSSRSCSSTIADSGSRPPTQPEMPHMRGQYVAAPVVPDTIVAVHAAAGELTNR